MPKNKISEYSATNSANTDIGGINIDEGCAPSGINNAIREVMVQLKNFQTGASGDAFTFAGGVLISGATNTISGASVISGNINSSGTNTFSGSQVISGNINSSGTNTFSGTTVMSGANTISHAAGTASLPSITVNGDTNTGIFFPAADTIAFAEGGVESGRFTSTGALQLTNNLTFTGTGNRITGDFSNATVANRVLFQTSTTNGNTILNLIPNGTGTTCAFGMDTDPTLTNSSTGSINLVASTDVRLTAGIRGTGTYLPMTFYTGGSERMRIDTSGNVGIGTSSPGFKLEVVGGTNNGVHLKDAASATVFGGLFIQAANLALITRSNHALTFGTNDTERMRITSGGVVRINNTSDATFSAQLNVQFTSSLNCGLYMKVTNTNSSQSMVIFGNTTNDSVGSISTSGSATSYTTSSDYRLKENIAPMTGALATVSQLKPVAYTWKSDGSAGQGFIAHELQAVIPDAVTGEKDAVNEDGSIKPQGVDTSFLVATLTAAIQELKAELDTVKAELSTLKEKP